VNLKIIIYFQTYKKTTAPLGLDITANGYPLLIIPGLDPI